MSTTSMTSAAGPPASARLHRGRLRRAGALGVSAAMVGALLMGAGTVASSAQPQQAGTPAIELTAPTSTDPATIDAGDVVDVSFTGNRAWPFVVDYRATPGGDWETFDADSGSGTAELGDNTVEVSVPGTAEPGEYDVRLRLFTPGSNPDRHRPRDEHIETAALVVADDGTRHFTDFSGDDAGAPPEGWSAQWRDSSWTVLHDPSRLRHEVDEAGGRRALTWDVPGADGWIDGDVEVSTVVQLPDGFTATRFQLPIHVTGEAGSESGYYLDGRSGSIRLNRYTNGSFTNLAEADLPYTIGVGAWYHVVLQREGDNLRAKIWPNGMAEPEEWLVEASDSAHHAGRVGVAHLTAESVNDWAWYGVGTSGSSAPRAPADLFPLPDPDPLLTGFEERAGSQWTGHDEELEFLAAVDAASERMTYDVVGETVEGRPIHLVRLGHPAPPADAEIADGASVLIIGTQHGNEPAPREMALQMLRDLALTDDPELIAQLEETTVLVIPTANPDGREANIRRNADDVDTNRDHLHVTTPEAQAMARVLRDFTPHITVDAHERPGGRNPDMELLWPRNLNVHEPVRELAKEMVEDFVWPDTEDAGYTVGLYGPNPGSPGDENEMIGRNVIGLRHGLGMLTETAGQDPHLARVDAQMATMHGVLRFQRESAEEVAAAVTAAPLHKEQVGADQSEPFYLFGADNDPPGDGDVMDPPPCGYVITAAQAELIAGPVELFPLVTEQVGEDSVFVTMAQPLMTVVPLLLDGAARANLVDGVALYDPAECANPASVTPPAE
ncbi:M14 family metallopeptidase [Phytoactinopolyspora limicola]|uniref:M14 family metallopeptidase n=1 Tax=Phytoactinopolyspora limicola TaxID=2715536 RepID=UPI00140D721E|nr:M14 family metallocarboxypeptidase [Phytoactinopolyspora limicola]